MRSKILVVLFAVAVMGVSSAAMAGGSGSGVVVAVALVVVALVAVVLRAEQQVVLRADQQVSSAMLTLAMLGSAMLVSTIGSKEVLAVGA